MRRLLPWGRYPKHPQQPHPVSWRSEVPALLQRLQQQAGTTLPWGNGRSYGDSCLAVSDHVCNLRPLDRFISVDWSGGTLLAEAGVTLDEVLRLAIPHGWFLPVTPGTRFVTLGGAVANDVHGKNHHRRGTFGCHVQGFELLRSDGSLQWITPGSELFAATVGGLGLTGIITRIAVQLMPVNSSQVMQTRQRFAGIDDFFALSDELDAQHEYSVAWVDCCARGTRLGRGVYMVADHADYGELATERLSRFSVPVTPPLSLINRLSLRAFNAAYWRAAPASPQRARCGYGPFFYPLDGIRQWNRIYGPAGFQQYQCVLPEGVAREALSELLALIAAADTGSFLAVLKRCGEQGSPGWLSFPLSGVSLALDFPQQAARLNPLFQRMDALVHEAGGRLYPAKDAHMRGEDFRQAYPQWQRVEALRDPAIQSRFWQRVTT
ncbi:FAD-binding oxidoreductase [Halopseudomonas salegens]|uniref:FAD/FMN-containing dehydrogenase n=1 Tax=Halopseudomonas salegens TaxID=1434072 RepID=A0A1H2EGB5_9GAMM|nr:FAD/FMN-containing dehydrogenase [Halopseudomonas salegens]